MLYWSLYNVLVTLYCRNACDFNGKTSSSMQVIYRCTHWLRMWSTLQRTEYQSLFKAVCMRLERMARMFLPNMGGNIISGSVHLLRRHWHSFGLM